MTFGQGVTVGRSAGGRSVVQGAFALLEELGGADDLGPSELSARTGLPKATVHRLLEQLLGMGAVERVDGRYRVGATMFRLGHAWRPAGALRAAARGPIRELAAAVPGSLVNVVVPQGGRSVVAGFRDGPPSAVLPLRVGAMIEEGTEPDLLFAAHRPDADPPPGVPAAEWRRRVRRVRDRDGVVLSHEARCAPEIAVVGAPVHAPDGQVVGSIGLITLGNERLAAAEPLVRRAARLAEGNLARGR